jgi:hypothetical protein
VQGKVDSVKFTAIKPHLAWNLDTNHIVNNGGT